MRSFEKGKVSIITPCYNGERFLDRYFDSICKQTYDNIELIFVNDERSNDNTEKICISWKQKLEKRGYRFRYVLQKKFRWVAGAINEGLPYVSGEFLIWPDCDDTLMPSSIQKRVEFLNHHPDYAMVRSGYVSVNEIDPGFIIGDDSDWAADAKNEDIFDDLIFDKTFPMPGSYMVRSEILFERIPNKEIYCGNRGGQNWQILLPCSYKNKTGYIDEPLYVYYYHPDSHSNKIEGDIYSSQKRRNANYHDILIHVMKDFYLLSETERNDYLARIDLKYVLRRFDLALKYNKLQDAKTEMQKLRNMHIHPDLSRKILYLVCFLGVSGYIIRGGLLIPLINQKIRLMHRRI